MSLQSSRLTKTHGTPPTSTMALTDGVGWMPIRFPWTRGRRSNTRPHILYIYPSHVQSMDMCASPYERHVDAINVHRRDAPHSTDRALAGALFAAPFSSPSSSPFGRSSYRRANERTNERTTTMALSFARISSTAGCVSRLTRLDDDASSIARPHRSYRARSYLGRAIDDGTRGMDDARVGTVRAFP